MITQSFFDSPSYYQVTINNSPTTSDVWIVDHSDQKELKQVQTKPDAEVLNVGDVVNWNGVNWLTLIVDDMSGIYYRGSIRRCVDTIKWQDSDGSIKEVPFFLTTDISRSLGLNQDNYLIIGDERRYITIPRNPDTLKITKGQRFIFDGKRSWSVDSINTLNLGLINLTLEEYQIDESKDNVELRVCDYITHTYTLSILNGDSATIRAGSTLQLNLEVRDNGNVVNEAITYSSGDSTIATVSSTGLITTIANGSVTITAKLTDHPEIQDSFILNVQLDSTNHFTVNVLDVSPINVGYSKTFTAQILNNGVVDNTKFVQWHLFADDGVSPTSLATMTLNSTTQCTLKANAVGYVKLKCVMLGSSSTYSIQRIQLKSLI
jgi:hypothetical protein